MWSSESFLPQSVADHHAKMAAGMDLAYIFE